MSAVLALPGHTATPSCSPARRARAAHQLGSAPTARRSPVQQTRAAHQPGGATRRRSPMRRARAAIPRPIHPTTGNARKTAEVPA
ncbi:hypothetical protein ABZ342_14390 [Amycolatopsis sp. NPDC005961]|uniref:hypothetical protein n=1 Tax=Amycolatopsis sp. NPDC005961 TaxID=3156720 RepID=UPI0033C472E5